MLKKSNASKMNWLKTKASQSGQSAGSPINAELRYQRASRLDQCNYVFNNDVVEKQFNSHITDIKGLVFINDIDAKAESETEMNASQKIISVVCDNIRSMSTLISLQNSISELISDLLGILCTENFVKMMLTWTRFCLQKNEYVDRLIEEQFILYDFFITQSNQQFLTENNLLQPLLELLELCSMKLQNDLSDNLLLEEKFLFTLHQICISITSQSEVLDLIFDGSNSDDKFSVFNLLIPFVHREGMVGQQARDALLLIMSLSAKHDKIGLFIANESNFCPVLATGLSGLYSSLPCKLEYPSDDWHQISDEDVTSMPDLKMFLNSLEFCNAVVQASHPAVCSKLLEFIIDGFLHPVIGPALNQTTIEEVVAATSYLDLFIRKITEPSLLKIFVEFILTGNVDNVAILDLLIARISSQLTRLCVVTLMLFYSLVDLNCEDVMFHLVFKHIVRGEHIMLSQHHSVREVDFYASDAGKFLSMIPECCQLVPSDNLSVASSETSFSSTEEEKPTSKFSRFNFKTKKSTFSPFSPLSPLLKGSRSPRVDGLSNRTSTSSTALEESSYGDYLVWAQHMISSCNGSCQKWLFKYDATWSIKEIASTDTKVTNGGELKGDVDNSCNTISEVLADLESQKEQDDLTLFLSHLNELDEPVPGESNLSDLLKEIDLLYGEVCCQTNIDSAMEEVHNHVEGQQTSEDLKNYHLMSQLLSPSEKPLLGPFLEALFSRVERMVQSTLYVNLQLTSLITRLSCYPQPLLKSLILSHNLIFQPSVKSFLQVLSSVKKKLEEYLNKMQGRESCLTQAHQFLAYRTSPDVSLVPFEVFKSGGKRKSSGFQELLQKLNHKNRITISNSSAQYIHRQSRYSLGNNEEEERESIERKNAIYAALVFKEFLKELAAVSQEHAIVRLS